MRSKGSKLERRLEVEYTSKPVSGWGGLVAFERFLTKAGVREVLRRGLPDGRISNNQIDVVDSVLQFFTSVLIGGWKFEHVERVRWDEVLRQLMARKRFGSASSLTRSETSRKAKASVFMSRRVL